MEILRPAIIAPYELGKNDDVEVQYKYQFKSAWRSGRVCLFPKGSRSQDSRFALVQTLPRRALPSTNGPKGTQIPQWQI